MANQLIIERALDGNGNVAAGAQATVYLTETTTLVSVYSDKEGTIPAANPIVADANGFWPQRFVSVTPKVVVTTADDATLYTLDPAPVTFGTGAAASGVSFDPTVEVPEDNVQDAIESVAATVVGGLTSYGIGVTGNAPLLANIDATDTASGIYRWDGASTGTFPAGINAATTGLIDFDRQTAAEGMQTLRALGQSRSYQRFMTSTAWGAWRETPGMTDPGGNRVLGWDDTANAFAWFEAGAGVSLADNAIAVTTGRVLLATKTASASATLEFTEFDNATYRYYEFELENVKPATDAAGLFMRVSTNGGSSYDGGASDYAWAGLAYLPGGSTAGLGGLSENSMGLAGSLGNAAGERGYTGTVKMFNAGSASRVRLQAQGQLDNTAGQMLMVNSTGTRLADQDTDGFQFLFSSGNIASGTIRMYGLP